MKVLSAFAVPLLVVTACVSPTTVEFDELPSLSSPDSIVIGVWEKTSSTQTNTSLACMVRMVLKSEFPIILEAGEIRLVYDTYGATVTSTRPISPQEINSVWGNQRVDGTKPASLKIHPTAFSYGIGEDGRVELYRGSYTATIWFSYHGDSSLQSKVSHTWQCKPPN